MHSLKPLTLALCFCASGAFAAEVCPAAPDHSAAIADTLAKVQAAQNQADARQLSDSLWLLWTDAPDAKAQEMLDKGMRAREVADFATAATALDALVAYCPDYAEGHNQRAFVAFLTFDFQTALTRLDRAIELSPNHVAAISGRGLTLLQMGRTKAGLAAIRDALELNPWIPERAYLPPDTSQEL